jgi:hypothetical protein
LGDGSVPSVSIDQDSKEDAEKQKPKDGGVKNERGPVLSHVLGKSKQHDAILAEFPINCVTHDRWKPPIRKKVLVLFTAVNLSPSTTALPGSAALQQLANGIAAWALVGSLIGLLFGAGMWALGANTQNSSQSLVGRRAVFASLVAAVLIGAAPHLINFFFTTGQKVK